MLAVYAAPALEVSAGGGTGAGLESGAGSVPARTAQFAVSGRAKRITVIAQRRGAVFNIGE